jgi:hypothetical protein
VRKGVGGRGGGDVSCSEDVVDNVGMRGGVGDGDGSGDVCVATSNWLGGGGAQMGETDEGTGERGEERVGDVFIIGVGRRGIGARRKNKRGWGEGGGGSVIAWRSATVGLSMAA